MSQENIKRVGRFVNAHDVDAMLELATPDCVIVGQRSSLEGAFTGRDGVRRWAETAYEWASDSRMVVERILPREMIELSYSAARQAWQSGGYERRGVGCVVGVSLLQEAPFRVLRQPREAHPSALRLSLPE